jgi:hypothetical protein
MARSSSKAVHVVLLHELCTTNFPGERKQAWSLSGGAGGLELVGVTEKTGQMEPAEKLLKKKKKKKFR